VKATNLPPQECNLTHFQEGDVLVANIRPYLKKVWLADGDGGCSNDVLVFRAVDGHKSAFLYAVLLQDSFFDYTMQGAKGSKMPRGDKEQIMRYEIPMQSHEDYIGSFIVNIKDKIEILNSINRNLTLAA
jgi:type I restriction enzyme S subunit